jgi:hypothetical protein
MQDVKTAQETVTRRRESRSLEQQAQVNYRTSRERQKWIYRLAKEAGLAVREFIEGLAERHEQGDLSRTAPQPRARRPRARPVLERDVVVVALFHLHRLADDTRVIARSIEARDGSTDMLRKIRRNQHRIGHLISRLKECLG